MDLDENYKKLSDSTNVCQYKHIVAPGRLEAGSPPDSHSLPQKGSSANGGCITVKLYPTVNNSKYLHLFFTKELKQKIKLTSSFESKTKSANCRTGAHKKS